MAQQITIAGTLYLNVPEVDIPKVGGGTAKFVDTSDANAASYDISEGKTAYVDGQKVTGTRPGSVNGDTPAYQHTVPPLMGSVAVNKIGGKTVMWNQLDKYGDFTDLQKIVAVGGTASLLDGVCTYEATSTGTRNHLSIKIGDTTINGNGHKFIIFAQVYNLQNSTFEITVAGTASQGKKGGFTPALNAWQDIGIIYTSSLSYLSTYTIYLGYTSTGKMQAGDIFKVKNLMVIDLTAMFGAGNEPTTVAEFKAMFPEDYYAYNAGSLLNANVVSVDSKDEDSVSLGSLSIPSALRTAHPLLATREVHDEYDIDRKKFVQRVGTRAYQSGDESDSSVITDGTTTYYALAASVETDISEHFFGTNLLTVEPSGTVTFTQSNTVVSHLPIPNGTVYALESNVPIEVSTDAGMTAVLTDSNVGRVYKFTGTTGTYTNGDLYVVEEGS